MLPMRIGVGAIVINKDNKIFVGKRKDFPKNDKWQMPQGGVNDGEKLLEALRRELEEETSIKSIKILKEIDEWTEYELPNYLLGKIWKGRFRGQKQKWFVLKFTGSDDEINLKTSHPEFIEWKWVEIDKITNTVVSFKLNVYKNIKEKIKKILN